MTRQSASDGSDGNGLNRRSYLTGLAGAAGAGALAGCGGLIGGGGGDSNELEIIHWWTSGSEEAALNALKDVFKEENPDIDINNNPAPGGAGSAFDTKIKNRILGDNPPSTFQIWPGKAMTPYVEADALKSIGDVWTDGMKNNYLQGVKNAAKFDGEYKAVPVNIHRLNNLFYNANVLDEAGVDPTSLQSPGDVVDAMEKVENNTNAVGMAQAQKVWTTLQMWETILIAEAGVGTFNKIINGNASANESAIKNSLDLVNQTREYWNEDAASISWDQGAAKVIKGNAAFIHQGDWAAGEFLGASDFKYGEDWDNMAFPGSKGVYSLVMDSFVYPKPNPSPDATEAWLQTCGSKKGQIAFNKEKGSIPPRSDVSDEEFGPFQTAQMKDFKNSNKQPPTIAHGAAVSPSMKSDIEGVFSSFIESWDVQAATNSLVDTIG